MKKQINTYISFKVLLSMTVLYIATFWEIPISVRVIKSQYNSKLQDEIGFIYSEGELFYREAKPNFLDVQD